MFYYLYQITNLVNGKIYVGVHKTRDMNDGYMGSGRQVLGAFSEYGINNFTKTILETFTNPKEMYLREKEIVNSEFLSRPDVYNIRRGGTGGFDYINKMGLNDRSGYKFSTEQKRNISISKKKSITDEYRHKISERMKGNKIGLGKSGNRLPRTENHRKKISESIKKMTSIYEEVSCPICNKIGAKNGMTRWHFNNCKMRE